MDKKIVIIIIAVIGIIFLNLVNYLSEDTLPTGKFAEFQKECREINETYEDCKTVKIPYISKENCKEVSYAEQECVEKDLSYRATIDQIKRTQTCIKAHEECYKKDETSWGEKYCKVYRDVCDTYKETASFELTNLDTETGTWTFDWRRACRENQKNCKINELVYFSRNVTLKPNETKIILASITYDASAQEYLYPFFTYVPKKKICEKTTKNQKSCEPVIEYKEEEKCENLTRIVQKCN
jgi:uncharacterized protein YxeA